MMSRVLASVAALSMAVSPVMAASSPKASPAPTKEAKNPNVILPVALVALLLALLAVLAAGGSDDEDVPVSP